MIFYEDYEDWSFKECVKEIEHLKSLLAQKDKYLNELESKIENLNDENATLYDKITALYDEIEERK